MKNLPRDVSDFEKMITQNYVYVDKTQYIYNLYATGDTHHFLSRPRRFGKSLLVSTLKELFSGNKELFKDLWIGSSDYKWQEYSVIHLDFADISHETATELKLSLGWALNSIAQQYAVDISQAPTLNAKFSFLVKQLAQKNKVVLLIDEYDKPVLDHIENKERAKAQQAVLKSFYDTIKGLNSYLHAVFITGVSKFSKTSIFSGLNNLIDITMASPGVALLGYTKSEIEYYFKDYIDDFAHAKKRTVTTIMNEMEVWYNGYRFSQEPTRVYNPYSVLYYLKDKEQANYWFESGTPSFLIKLIQNQYDALEDIKDIELSVQSLGTFDITHIPLIPLLFQTGYLTITDYNRETKKYKLNYPNAEVSESFQTFIITALTEHNATTVERSVSRMVKALNSNDVDAFCMVLQSLFAHIPSNLYIEQERYFHSLFQFLGNLLGLEIQSEIVTDKGRIDLVITTNQYIYIFELKFNTSPDVALQQIEDRRYYERYLISKQHIVLIGLAFNYKKKKLTLEWQKKLIQ
ncbi:AAA family ATPase [Candidatus Dependentiae bacterium]|nr:AAA family ATPase [Candidatus Dependentiae bacterium]